MEATYDDGEWRSGVVEVPGMEPSFVYAARVLRIVDADTYDVEVDLGFRVVARLPLRLAHIDAPEKWTPEGKAAIAYVTELFGELPAQVVVHTFKPVDKYGRYLADVFVDEFSVAEVLIEDGYGHAYEGGTR